ncbi:putative TetR family transcriptional regulator [Gordonia effusa NBRC 100432]|uniref:Putative TetR family transcriptional regulator n=1 Tax=Gordonia effusa NBRC 100432 TaxID=1077974 RepID=H0R1C3_9ACTN|nr:TetR/AcrR family transcriptional regulator [Gordonia effusa]GAB18874.1 putative TetR family transcriptional regulator [Gordonia effusa NBRC 100432]
MKSQSADDTGRRILDATIAAVTAFGTKHASVEAIAKRAGVSHMTVYRRWPRKEQLFAAAFDREAGALYASLDAVVAGEDDFENALVVGFTEIFWTFYNHPLVTGEYERSPEVVLMAFTAAAEPTMRRSIDYLAGQVESRAGLSGELATALAECSVRITHSLLLTSLASRPFADRSAVSVWARTTLLPLMQIATRSAGEPGR